MAKKRADLTTLPAYCRAMRAAAKERKMNVMDISKAAGVAHGTVVKVWSGDRRVLLDHILSVAAAVGVTITLTPGEPPPPPKFRPIKLKSVRQGFEITLSMKPLT